jgi:hypothetical protein
MNTDHDVSISSGLALMESDDDKKSKKNKIRN